MSLLKAIKGWRVVLSVIRNGYKTNLNTTKAGRVVLRSHNVVEYDAVCQPRIPLVSNSFFKSIFSKASRYLKYYSPTPLHPIYAGRLRKVPLFSLLGFCLASDLVKCNQDRNREESLMTDIYIKNIFKDYKWEPKYLEAKPQSLKDLIINEFSIIGKGCEGAVFEAKLKDTGSSDSLESDQQDYDLAVKSVFNYYAESNANSILKKLHKEVVPLYPSELDNIQMDDVFSSRLSRLPPHPNIVDLYCVFVDDMLVTEEGQIQFSAALPRHVNPDACFGHNKTLHLVMKKCTMDLSKYLTFDPSMETRCLLLMQLLEAVCHMTSCGVAHRDIKPDNILIDLTPQGKPHLQVCDFGCCLAEEDKQLVVPYVCSDTNMGGNACLMAPEISTARPGPGSVLDYRKSDLWACGTLAYQILGESNPFYKGSDSRQLRSQTYTEEELPPLPDQVPNAIKRLVKSLLHRDPVKRPSPAVAVLVVQLEICDLFSSRHGHNHSDPIRKRCEMERIWDEVIRLIGKMVSCTADTANQDITDVSKFFCLSRFSYSDFMEAREFFQ